MADYYIGKISKIVDELKYEVEVDIPGIIEGIKAFPTRDQIDEPKLGDQVLICSLDPIFGSYMIYRKLKEDDFIGFRSNGKYVSITPESITIGVFDKDVEYEDNEVPDVYKAKVVIDNEGNIELEGKSVLISGSTTIQLSKTAETPINKVAKNPLVLGGFSAIGVCPVTGIPHCGQVLTYGGVE